MNLRSFIINKPAFLLSEQNYFRYIIVLSNVFSKFKLTKNLGYKNLISSIDNKTSIIELTGTQPAIRIQSAYRVSRFLKGFKHAGARQWDRYKLRLLLMGETPDIFVDIGANIGEVSFFADVMGIKRIVAFEPDPVINDILKFNLRNTSIKIDGRAVGNSNGKVTLFSSPETADSSLIKPEFGGQSISVESITLKNLLSNFHDGSSILVKIDAEGFEPEILTSGDGVLRKVKYFAIDVSPERMGKSTYHDVKKVLLENAFELIFESDEIISAKRIGNYAKI